MHTSPLQCIGWIFFCMKWLSWSLCSTISLFGQDTVHIAIRATALGPVIDGRIFGTNLTNESRTAYKTVHDSAFVRAAAAMGIKVVRFPGGNNADAYDWKEHVRIQPGRRVAWDGAITLAEIAAFCQRIGAELSITVNFGTGTAQDAADLVEYLNGPTDSHWGALRAAHGFDEPLDVRFFEIGNEINQPHQWYHSWTAEDPYKYFFGGSEERRGNYIASANLDPIGKKGDAFKANGKAHQLYYLRFPPVRNVHVYWAATESDARLGKFSLWTPVASLEDYGPLDSVYQLDSLEGILRFGDGIHGAIPPAGSWFVVEYTTYGHEGFLDFARAMRSAPSSVPIQIGAVMLPFHDRHPIASDDSMRQILHHIDFIISHQYGASIPTDRYSYRRQIALERTEGTSFVRYARFQQYARQLGVDKSYGVGITEWNIFLDVDSWKLNRTQEAAVIAAEFFIRLINGLERFPVRIAHQFALGGVWLSLYNNWTSYQIGPMGYVFEGFKPWSHVYRLEVDVRSPSAMAYDTVLPYVQAAASIDTMEHAIYAVITNSAEDTPLPCVLHLEGMHPALVHITSIESNDPYDHNDGPNGPTVSPQTRMLHAPFAWTLQPHAVYFLRITPTATHIKTTKPSESTRATAFPNPFLHATTIHISPSSLRPRYVDVFDIRGHRVRRLAPSEKGTFYWDGRDRHGRTVPRGVYLYSYPNGSKGKNTHKLIRL